MLGEGSANFSLKRVSDATGRLGAASACSSLGRVLIDDISLATTTNVVVWCLMIHHLLLTSKLLIEAEDSSLSLTMSISESTASGGEIGVGLWSPKLGGRCWTLCCSARGDVLRVDLDMVSGTTSSVPGHVRGWDRWVWLGDAVVARHGDDLVIII